MAWPSLTFKWTLEFHRYSFVFTTLFRANVAPTGEYVIVGIDVGFVV